MTHTFFSHPGNNNVMLPLEQFDARWPVDLATALAQLSCDDEFFWLDSGDQSDGISTIGVSPLAVIEQAATFETQLHIGASVRNVPDPWQAMRELRLSRPLAGDDERVTLGPGWYGYVGFEHAASLDRSGKIPPRDSQSDFPLVRMALFDQVFVLDHAKRRGQLLTDPNIRRVLRLPPAGSDVLQRWQTAAGLAAMRAGADRSPRILDRTEPAAYKKAVDRAKDYIAAGDIYQVNLSQRLTIGPIANPLSAYAALRVANPAAFGALLKWRGAAVASVSPELFLECRAREVRTCPIKGTRPRTLDPPRDRAAIDELLASPKEAAELAMIVDLHRNDLGRVCEWGSVQVVEPRRLEVHPTVFHTVAEIRGRLRTDCDAIDLLRASFPAGSITGVPKIRAMQIIRELEPHPRGVYTGAIGGISTIGDMALNVAIRTLQIRGETGVLFGGGGIVAESDPAAEYAETLAKIHGILRGLGVD